jgi:diguanylate cyclase (GGDEF)-like protein
MDNITLDLARVFDNYPNPFYIVRPILLLDGTAEDYEFRYVNQAFCRLMDRTKEELEGHRYRENFGKGNQQWIDLFVDASTKRKHIYMDGNCDVTGKKIYTETFHIPPNLCGCIIYDVESIPAVVPTPQEQEIRHRAHYDYLTGFYNRFYLQETSKRLEAQGNLGILCVDVNDMKQINDTYGHRAGDRRILQVCDRLRQSFAQAEHFRVGGDEFVVIVSDCTREGFLDQAKDIQDNFSANGLASVGYAYYDTVDNLMVCLDRCDDILCAQRRQAQGEPEPEPLLAEEDLSMDSAAATAAK